MMTKDTYTQIGGFHQIGSDVLWQDGFLFFPKSGDGVSKPLDIFPMKGYELAELRNLAMFNKNQIPSRMGFLYFLFLGDELVYVGQTLNLKERLDQHRADKSFDSWCYFCVSESELSDQEALHIGTLKPRYNKTLPRSSWRPIRQIASEMQLDYKTIALLAKESHTFDWLGLIYCNSELISQTVEIKRSKADRS